MSKNINLSIKKSDIINKVFFIAFFVDVVGLVIVSQFTDAANSLALYIGLSFNSFTDFSDTVMAAQGNPYDVGVIYPPLCYLLCKIMGGMIPGFKDFQDTMALRDSQMGRMVYTYFVVLCVLVVFFVIVKFCKYDNLYKICLSLVIVLSVPFLSTVDRGNFLLLCTVCVIVFVAFYDSENKFAKELALICLAVAAAIKIYPAVLGLLLIKKGNTKTVVRTVIYGLVAFALPAFAFDGLTTLKEMVTNLTAESNKNVLDQNSISGRVDLPTVFLTFLLMFKHNLSQATFDMVEKISKIVGLLFSAEMVVLSFVSKDKWKKVLALTSIMLVLPSFSYEYCLISYLAPLLIFLVSDHKKFDWLYVIAFFIMTVPFAFNPNSFFEGVYGYGVRGVVVLENIGQAFMFAILQIDFIVEIIKNSKKKKVR